MRSEQRRQPLAETDEWIRDHAVAVVVVTLVLAVVVEALVRGRPRTWDWVWVSGMVTVALALPPALRMSRVAADAIERLGERGVLVGSGPELVERTNSSSDAWSRALGPGAALAVCAAFLTRVVPQAETPRSGGLGDVGNHVVEVALGVVAAFLVGRAAGRLIGTAGLGQRIEHGEWTIRVQPGHIDGAAGLRPVGDLFFRQAMVIAILAVWLIVVLVLKTIAVLGADGWAGVYQVVRPGTAWGPWYFVLLVFAVALEVAAFLVPMLSFHRVMTAQRRTLLLEADRDSERLHRLEREAPDIADDERRRSAEEQISRLRDRYLRCEQLPTWPVDTSLRRRFTVRNIVLLVPVVANAIGLGLDSDVWDRLSEILG